jgi:NADPH-dependent 2,4-dienoyl-CoA reductase/sulfur reductase-like enzyme
VTGPGRIVIVGGGAAGIAVAESARSAGFDGRLIMLTRERHLPYDRPSLSKQVLSGVWDPDRVRLRDETRLRSLGLEILTREPAAGLDADASELLLSGGGRVPYDRLAVTTGVDPVRLPATDDLGGVHVLRDLDHALALRDALTPGRRLVVIGAGVLGSEVAAVATGRGVSVTLVDREAVPLTRVVAAPVGDLIVDLHREHGVALELGHAVRSLQSAGGAVTGVELTGGRRLPADVVLVAVGARPATGWLAGSAVGIGGPDPDEGAGGILCEPGGRAAPNVYAAGDVAAWRSPGTDAHRRVEHRLNASEQGRAVARSMLDPHAVPAEPVPYFWSDHYDLKLQCFGVTDPRDEFVVVDGSLPDRAFVGASVRAGRVTAVTGIGMQRRLRAWSTRIGLPPVPPS